MHYVVKVMASNMRSTILSPDNRNAIVGHIIEIIDIVCTF